MAIKIKITQIRSGIGRPENQRRTLAGLGLGKLHRSVVLQDTPAIRGMIVKVSHLVTIAPVE
jgi:large subunit ribosomal protein L30